MKCGIDFDAFWRQTPFATKSICDGFVHRRNETVENAALTAYLGEYFRRQKRLKGWAAIKRELFGGERVNQTADEMLAKARDFTSRAK